MPALVPDASHHNSSLGYREPLHAGRFRCKLHGVEFPFDSITSFCSVVIAGSDVLMEASFLNDLAEALQ